MILHEERHNTFRAHARAFIEAHGEGRDSRWREGTEILRNNIHPDLFEYSVRRSRGEEPPPHSFRWPRSSAQGTRDYVTVTLKVDERKGGGAIFNSIDFEKAYSGRDVKNLQDSPLDEDLGPKDEKKAEGGWLHGPGPFEGSFATEPPDQRVSDVDYESVDLADNRDDGASIQRIEANGGAETWENQPARLVTRSQESWTREQERQLIHLVVDLETEDWHDIAGDIGMSEIECQEKYRKLADLPLRERSRKEWTTEEDVDLLRFRGEYQSKDWVRMSSQLEHSVEDCQQRYQQLSNISHSHREVLTDTMDPNATQSSAPAKENVPQMWTPASRSAESRGKKRHREAEDDGAELASASKASRTDMPTAGADGNYAGSATKRKRPGLILHKPGHSPVHAKGREGEQQRTAPTSFHYSPKSPSYSPLSEDEWPSQQKRRDILSTESGPNAAVEERRGRNRTRQEDESDWKNPELLERRVKSPERQRELRKPLKHDAEFSTHKRKRDEGNEDEDTARPPKKWRLLPPKPEPLRSENKLGVSIEASNHVNESKRPVPSHQGLREGETGVAEGGLSAIDSRRRRKRRRDVSDEEEEAQLPPPRRSERIAKAQKTARSQNSQAGDRSAAVDTQERPLRRSSRLHKKMMKR